MSDGRRHPRARNGCDEVGLDQSHNGSGDADNLRLTEGRASSVRDDSEVILPWVSLGSVEQMAPQNQVTHALVCRDL